jgi:hypothetical protein
MADTLAEQLKSDVVRILTNNLAEDTTYKFESPSARTERWAKVVTTIGNVIDDNCKNYAAAAKPEGPMP